MTAHFGAPFASARRGGTTTRGSARSTRPARAPRDFLVDLRARVRHRGGGLDLLRHPAREDGARVGRPRAGRLHVRAQAAAGDHARAPAARRGPTSLALFFDRARELGAEARARCSCSSAPTSAPWSCRRSPSSCRGCRATCGWRSSSGSAAGSRRRAGPARRARRRARAHRRALDPAQADARPRRAPDGADSPTCAGWAPTATSSTTRASRSTARASWRRGRRRCAGSRERVTAACTAT